MKDDIDELIDLALARGEKKVAFGDVPDKCKQCKRAFHGLPKDGCQGFDLEAIESQGVINWEEP